MTGTRLGVFCARLLEAGWLVAVAAIPMYFNIYSNRVFEPDKITLLRSLVVVMALAQLVRWLEGTPPSEAGGSAASGPAARGAAEVHPNGSSGPTGAVPRVWWRWWPANPLAFPTLILVATYLLGTVFSVTPAVSIWGSYQRLQGTYSMFSYIVLFFLIAANLRSRAQIERLFNVILLVSVPISLYGIIQHQRLDPLPWGGDVTARITASMGNAIFLAAYLIMVVPITLQRLIGAIARLGHMEPPRGDEARRDSLKALLLSGTLVGALFILTLFTASSALSPNLWWAAPSMIGMFTALSLLFTVPCPTYLTTLTEAVGYIALLTLQLTATFLTASRGPWIGILAGLACFAIVLAVRRRARRLLVAWSALGAALLVFLVLFNLPGSPLAPLRQVPYVGRLGVLLETETGTGRVRTLIWQGTWQLLTTRPPIGLGTSDPLGPARLLVGYGPEAMYVAYNKVYPPDLAHYEARNASPDRNHNDTLDHVVNVGLLGLLAYMFVLAAAFYLLWQHLRRAQELSEQLPIVGVLAALVAHVVESQTGIVIAATSTYFWVYLAVAGAAGLFYRSREQAAGALKVAGMMEVAAAANPTAPLAGSAVRLKRRRDRRSGGSGHERSPNGRSAAGALALPRPSGLPYPALVFSLFVVAALPLLGRVAPFPDAQLPFALGFFGLIVAAGAIALSLGTLPRERFWRSGNWWVYGLGLLVAAAIVVQNLNVVAADVYFKRGLSYDQSGRFDLSVPEYNRALQLAGDQDYYYLFLGRAYLELAKRNQRPAAMPPFEPTLEKVRGITGAQLAALGREDMLNASRAILEQARDLSPLNTDHYANLGRLHRIWGAMGDRTKLDLADGYYRQATTLSPQAAHLYDEWAQVDLDKGDPDAALAKVQVAVDLDPVFPTTFILLGDVYLQLGRPNEALEAHRKAIALDPAALSDARMEQRLAAYEKAGLLGQVEALYAKAAEDAPRSAALHAAYGYILSRQNKMREALVEFQANVRLAPTDWIAHRNLALIYRALGLTDQALSSAQAAQRYAPPEQAGNLQNFLNELQKK